MLQLSRFLAVMSGSGVVKVEETGKGVESITSVDLKHPLIRGFSPSLLVAADSTGDTCCSAAAVATVKSSTAKVRTGILINIYTVHIKRQTPVL